MHIFLILALGIFLVACIQPTGYGDGRLIRIDTDSAFTNREKELIKNAAHMWDAFGARLRTSDEVGDEPVATSILIERSSMSPPDTLATTFQVSNRITIYADSVWESSTYWQSPDPNKYFMNTVAHELGHAMGMQHVPAEIALMNAGVDASNQLTAGDGSDEEEWIRLYGEVRQTTAPETGHRGPRK